MSGKKDVQRVVFVTSHPIQYQVPVFRHLAERNDIDFQVLFAMLPDAATQGDGFGVEFEWDIPLLEGYAYRVLDNVARHPGVTRFSGCDTPGIRDVLKDINADVVVVNGWVVKTCLQAVWACRRLPIPCIVRGEANNLRPRSWGKRCLQRLLVRQYDACLPIGSANREFYRSHGIDEKRLFDSPYCVENDRFSRAAELAAPRRAEIRDRWQIPQDVICFLYCGKFETKKHPLELIHAIGGAVSQGAQLHLLMVGDGPLRAQCERIVRSDSLPVSFTGFLNQSEIVKAYVAADMLVLPSDHGETWGLVVNEAMACGLPAIVSDQVGCAADLIVDNETGWVFSFGDWADLSYRLAEASRSTRIDSMSQKCRRQVSHYSPVYAANGIVSAVQHVVDLD